MNDQLEILWRQYEMQIDLYKHYLKLAIEFNVFYYAITGAILSYYFAHTEVDVIRYALILPLLMSACFAGFFIYGALLMRVTREEVYKIRDTIGFDSAPEMGVLIALLGMFAILMITVALGLLFLFICGV